MLAAAAVAVVALAASAYAIQQRFVAGDDAPPAIKREFALVGRVRGTLFEQTGPEVIVERTRAAAVLRASSGWVYLWVAPTRSGDHCAFIQVVGTEHPDGRPNLAGGCGRYDRTLSLTYSQTSVRGGQGLTLLSGRVGPEVAYVEADGVRLRPSHRWLLAELARRPRLVVAYDNAGSEVAHLRFGAVPRPRALEPTGAAEVVLEIRTRRTRKRIVLAIHRAAEGPCRRVMILTTPGGTASGCATAPGPREIAFGVTQIGRLPRPGMVLLYGPVGRKIAEARLEFENGREERLRIEHGYVLYQVDPSNVVAGRRPVAVVGLDASGEVIARRDLR